MNIQHSVSGKILPLLILLLLVAGCPLDHDPPGPVTDPVVGSLDLTATSDSGVSDADNVTNDTTPSFTGTADMSGTLEIISDVDGVVYTGFVPAGNWGPVTAVIASHTGQAGTVHQLRARLTGQGGGVGQSDPLAVTFDTTGPETDAFDPVDNQVLVVWSKDPAVSFTEKVYAGTGSVTLRNITDAVDTPYDVASPAFSGWGTAQLTLNPADDLASNRNYCLLMDAGAVTDAAGNGGAGITDNTVWNFSSAIRDMFSYPTSGDLVTQSGGEWMESAGGTAVEYAASPGMAWSNYASAPNGSITCDCGSTHQDVRCELASPWRAVDGAVYLAFIIKEQTTPFPFPADGCGIAFYNGSSLQGGVSVYFDQFPSFGITAYVDDNTGNRQKICHQSYYDILVVFRYDPNVAAGGKLKGWYYVSDFDTGTVEGTGALSATAGFDPAAPWTQITHVGISQRWRYTLDIHDENYRIDALKVVSSWDDLDEGR